MPTRANELLELLKVPLPATCKCARREVYIGAGSRAWFVTYSPSLPRDYAPFSDADISDLLKRGEIESAFPRTDAQALVYRLRQGESKV